jgi:Helix-turn-helix domain
VGSVNSLPTPRQGVGPIAVCTAGSAPARRAAGAPRPYGALPHDLSTDPRLSPTDVRVAAALLYWARSRADCWPSDRSISTRVGRSPGTVQRSLRSLEDAGWIAREKSADNQTGRLIWLLWCSAGARPPAAPLSDPPAAPARVEEETGQEDAHNEPEAAVAVDLESRLKTEGLPAPLARQFASGDTASVARRVLLNVEILRAQGRLANPAGYLRAGIEGDYALLPEAAKRLDAARRAEETAARNAAAALKKVQAEAERQAEDAAAASAIDALSPGRLAELVRQAVAKLPPPLARRNPTIGNPFVRAKVVELDRIERVT